MQEDTRQTGPQKSSPRRRWWQSTWFRAALCVMLIGIISLTLAAIYIARHAEPLLRRRVVETLSHRFNSPVELDQLHISVARGLEVQGSGLRILYLAGPTQPLPQTNAPPMLSVRSFTFRTSLRELLHLRARIATVYAQGLEIHIPPHNDDAGAAPAKAPAQPKIALLVDHIVCRDAKLFIDTETPGKEPLEFDIPTLSLTDVGSSQPLLYQGDIINPKPRGNVHAFGHFGPWQAADPRSTAIDGDYTFDHADLATIRGLGGTLSSTGHFAGQLGRIAIDGNSSVPDFSLDISNHPVPLLASFHALVDGTTGDTTLAPVNATLGRSQFTCAGAILRIKGKGHDIALTVDMPRGRIEDILELSLKTNPPPVTGGVTMKAKLHIPPGPVRVAAKLDLSGGLTVSGVHFSSAKLQDRVDGLSMRAQGKPEEVKVAQSDHRAEVASRMTVHFGLAQELVTVESLAYDFPGAKVNLRGVYSLNGDVFEFKGHVRTDATASQMTTGWKSMLLKPFDGLLKKDGAGVELPLSITGQHGDFNISLAMRDADETPAQMAADLKARRAAAATSPH